MKNLIFVALGMFLMYILLKILSSRTVDSSMTTERLKDLLKTGEVMNLIKTTQFNEVIKTPEFRAFISTLAKDQLTTVSNSLVTY
jgi:hypothetical protein